MRYINLLIQTIILCVISGTSAAHTGTHQEERLTGDRSPRAVSVLPGHKDGVRPQGGNERGGCSESGGTIDWTSCPSHPATAFATPGPNDGEIKIYWTRPTASNSPRVVHQYEIGLVQHILRPNDGYATTDFFTKAKEQNLTRTVTSLTGYGGHTISGLIGGDKYDIRIRAKNKGHPAETPDDGNDDTVGPSMEMVGVTALEKHSRLIGKPIINGNVLTATYSQELDINSVPSASAFTVNAGPIGNLNRDLIGDNSTVSISGSEVEITLEEPAWHGNIV